MPSAPGYVELMTAIEKLASRLRLIEKADILPELTAQLSTTDGVAATILTIAMPASTTTHVFGVVVARRTGGSAGTAEDGAGFVIHAVVKVVAGVATLIGQSIISSHSDNVNFNADFAVSGANLLCRVAGDTNNTVFWRSWYRTRTSSMAV